MSPPARPSLRLAAEQRALLDRLLAERGLGATAAAIPRRQGAGAPPLSSSQRRLWFLDQWHDSPAYNLPVAIELTGPLAVAALAHSLAAVVARHEILRTRYPAAGGQPVQEVTAPPPAVALPRVDLRALAGAAGAARAGVERAVGAGVERAVGADTERAVGAGTERAVGAGVERAVGAGVERVARAIALAEARRPFDLAAGPVLRALLLRLADERHVLILTLHHIAADGWSMGVLVHEIAALYGAFLDRRAAPLAELPLQYADFALWQLAQLEGAAADAELAYWRCQLAAAPAQLGLVADRPRPAVRRARGASVPIELDPELAARFAGLGAAPGATLFMTLAAAFAALLARHGGGEQIVLGTPVAGRRRPELQGLVGCFVNTLALALDLAGDPPFTALLARVRDAALGAFAHQDLPFEQLVAALRPERDVASTPFFQAMLVLQNAPLPPLALPGLALRPWEFDNGTAKFDLVLTLAEAAGGGLAGALTYDADLFEAATALRLAAHLSALVAQVAGAPGVRLGEIPLLSPGERHQLLHEWNDSALALPPGWQGCVHEIFARQAARAPDVVAVEDGELRLSYGELERRAGRLARRLRDLGVGPEVRVGICLERSAAAVVAILAVWQAGGAYVPFDPAAPAARLSVLAADAAIAVVVSEERFAERLPEGVARALLDCAAAGGDGLGAPDGASAGPVNLAYVLYTSGSTGTPKGTLIGHAAVVNLALALRRHAYAGLAAPSRLTLNAPLSFDASLQQLVQLASGHTLVLVPDAIRRNGEELLAWLAERQVEGLDLTPSQLRLLLLAGLAERRDLALVRGLLGGEAIDEAVWRLLAARPEMGWYNVYGPTECTVDTTWAVLAAAVRPTIGRPFANVRVHLLPVGAAGAAAGEPLPIGVPGHLHVAGEGLARGYLDRPALTAERFVPDAAAGVPGGRLYGTGDRARRLADGSLEFLGRIDRQIKWLGWRIEPGEIEALLARQAGVRGAWVAVRADGAGRRRLVAYVAGDRAALPDLRAVLAARLPAAMIPSAFVVLERLPLTAHGKVDERALPPAAEEAPRPAAAAPPRTPVETILAAIWSEVLGVETVGVHDGFFDLGGHSLLATQVMSRLRASLAVELPLRLLFEAPTVAALAPRVEDALRRGIAAPPPLLPRPPGAALPLSFAQERLWFLAQLDPRSAAYHVPAALALRGELDAARLGAALAAVVARHEALRTRFVAGAGAEGPVQEIAAAAAAPLSLPLCDLSALPAAAGAVELARRLAAVARAPFDLARGPLLRGLLLRTAPRQHVAALTLHHIVSDDWSRRVLVRDLAAFYRGGREAARELPPLPVQYADFALWQRAWLRDEVLAAQLAFWRERLAGAPATLALPADRPRSATLSGRGATLPWEPAAALAGALRRLARRHEASVFMVLLAGFGALLGRMSGAEDLVVGAPLANRNRLETEELIGFFVNPVALRLDLAGEPTFADLVRRVRETALAAHAHQDLPFELLVEALAPRRDAAQTPLFQVVLAFQNAPQAAALELPGLALAPLAASTETAKYDLTLVVEEGEAAGAAMLCGALEWRTDLFDAATVRRLLGHLEMLLAAAAADPGRRVGELPWMSAAERAQVVGEWNDTRAPYPRDARIDELFAAQAGRTPAAVALVDGALHCTYGELERRAGRIAGRLAELGVAAETRVALLLPRSVAAVAAMLGVLKAGGAYVPLDPADPAERLRFLIADADAAALAGGARLERGDLRGELAAAGVAVVRIDEGGRAGEGGGPRRGQGSGGDEDRRNNGGAGGRHDSDAGGRHDSDGVGPGAGRGRGLGGEALACVLYTSGSTGRPKGVMVTHRGVARLVLGAACAALGPEEVLLQLAPLAFDASTFEIWGALLHGGRLVLFPPQPAAPGEIAAALARHGVTTLWLTAGLFHRLVEDAAAVAGLAGLRQLLAGGDVLSPPHVARALQALGNGVLINGYGPTEGTTFTTCETLRQDAAASGTAAGRPVAIGRPLGNTRVHLLDRGLEPVPVGIPGELCAGGDGLARGYLGRPELTAERFVPHPLGAPGERLYRTGDLARWLPDGRLDFLGRLDSQVKVRGFRVEPGEIEAALLRHPAVAAAAVVAPADPLAPGERRLVACVVLAGGSVPGAESQAGNGPAAAGPMAGDGPAAAGPMAGDGPAAAGPMAGDGPAAAGSLARELRAFVQELLPAHLVPAAVVIVPALPLTASGKLDRRSLLASLPAVDAAGAGAGLRPRTPLEELLAAIWAEVLGRERVGVEADFFELGGHSLAAVRLVSRVRAVCGVELALRTLFEAPTVAAVAAVVERRLHDAAAGAGAAAGAVGAAEVPPLVPIARGGALAPSFAQERMWFLDQLAPGQAAYNIAAAYRVAGRLDPALLARCFAVVVGRHESLRTTLPEVAGRPVLAIAAAPARFALPLADLGGLPEARRRRERDRQARAAAHLPFDLARGPLLRCLLLRLGAEEHALVVTVHHAVCDGASVEVMVGELSALLAALPAGAAPRLPELPVQYADFAAWQRRALPPPVVAAEAAFWKRQLAGVPPVVELPCDRPRPRRREGAGGSCPFTLAPALTAALRDVSRRAGATLFMALLASLDVLLLRHGAAERLAVGVPVAGRNRIEIEGLIGLFVNTLVIAADLAGDPGFAGLLGQVRERVLEAFAHQDVPFEKLVEELVEGRDLGVTPLFQVLFVLQSAESARQPAASVGGLALAPLPLAAAAPKLDLALALAEGGAGMAGAFDYDAALFDRTTVLRLLAHWQTLLAGVAAAPGDRLSELPLLGAAERAQLAAEWSGAAAARPEREGCLHALFEEQAARSPEALAVRRGDEALTYGELDRRANRLTRRLRRLGVGAEVRVGVCMGRSCALLVALLAVLKAGGAYVPLDPRYPRRRLALLAEDALPALLLCDAGSRAALPAGATRVVCLEEEGAALVGERAAPPQCAVAPGNLAYLIYTSGSTGRPKGVAIPHASAAAFVAWARQTFGAESLSAVVAATSICFDLSIFELFAPLASGGTVMLVADALDAAAAPAASLVNTVPSAAAELLRTAALPPGVATVNLAGEPLPAPLAEAVLDQAGVAALWNLYGPTETTTYSTAARVRRGDRRPPSIGRPIAGTEVHLVGRDLQAVPLGVAGELLIGGAGLARGYFEAAGLTAERFVPNPFAAYAAAAGAAPAGGSRLYRTGDLARHRADGELELLGRIDQQVKVRGFRIELGEIEAALGRHPAVAEAAVQLWPEPAGGGGGAADRGMVGGGAVGGEVAGGGSVGGGAVGGEAAGGGSVGGGAAGSRLVAYFVAAGEAGAGTAAATAEELRRFLGERLPAFEVPAAFVELPALPRTANGKLDRRALPALEGRRLASAGGFVAPRGPVEEGVAGLFRELLQVERAGADDDFFALGGHSLLASQALARVRQTFRVRVSLQELFEAPTVAGLAAAVARAQAAAVATGAAGEPEGPRGALDPIPHLAERNDAELLARLDDLDDEEVAALLAELAAEGDGPGRIGGDGHPA